MRIRWAQGVAIVTGVLIVALAGVFAWLQQPAWAAAGQAGEAALVERGIVVYREQMCQACHSIDGVGSRRSPLDGVGARLETEALRKWIVTPREMNPKVRKPAYDRLPKGDVDALVAYMKSLRTPKVATNRGSAGGVAADGG